LLLSFTIFWAYVAYFQFFLIWLANKPDETVWYAMRAHGAWRASSIALAVVEFVVPFFALLSYRLKRCPGRLAAVAGWLVLGRWIDVEWLVLRGMRASPFAFFWLDLAALLAIGGVSVAYGAWQLHGRSLVPRGDPSFELARQYGSA